MRVRAVWRKWSAIFRTAQRHVEGQLDFGGVGGDGLLADVGDGNRKLDAGRLEARNHAAGLVEGDLAAGLGREVRVGGVDVRAVDVVERDAHDVDRLEAGGIGGANGR
ncbi:MAG: hypothetical protein E6J43_13540 [Chloroflexi bacterium]|nr:MAG: hypothetical protein E6J43_13540 [Chloroflexota bacterium]